MRSVRPASPTSRASATKAGLRLIMTATTIAGFSGGTLDRPALQRLLRDVEAGRIDTIVCYKIDRLSRSLADFTKLVEILDRHSVSLVSITESFNTATSLGRLNLNMVLSFAQYERELAGERIRDKFLASRKRGLWMGGHVPFGYDVRDRKLVVNEAEAPLVRHIFQRFLQVGSATMLVQELNAAGHRTKRGKPFDKGVLYKLLNNRTYVGEVEHRGIAYPGEQEAIVDRATWDKVHAILAENGRRRASHTRAATPALLKGLIFGPDDRAMAPSHTRKRGRLYRFYRTATSLKLCHGECPIRAVPAGEVEAAVINQVRALLRAPEVVVRTWRAAQLEDQTIDEREVVEALQRLDPLWDQLFPASRRASCSCWSRAWSSGSTAWRSACGSRASAVWWRSFGCARARSSGRHDRGPPEPGWHHHHGVRPDDVEEAWRTKGHRGATRRRRLGAAAEDRRRVGQGAGKSAPLATPAGGGRGSAPSPISPTPNASAALTCAAWSGSRSSPPTSSSAILDGRPTAGLAQFLKPFPVEWERQREQFLCRGLGHSKEELHSINQELQTVNRRSRSRAAGREHAVIRGIRAQGDCGVALARPFPQIGS